MYAPSRKRSIPSLSLTPHARPTLYSGSWTSGSRKDHITFARQLVDKSKGAVTVAVIDYRLTEAKEPSTWAEAKGPQQYINCHPTHLEDVYAALRFLLLPSESDKHRSKRVKKSNDQEGRALDVAQKYGYDDSRVVIVGHEVGAWLAMATLLDPPRSSSGSIRMPSLCPDPYSRIALTRKTRAWICLSGVYDLVPILDKAPEQYAEPIAQTFPEDKMEHSRAAQLEAASVTSWPTLSAEHYHDDQEPRVELLFSLEDEIDGQAHQVQDVVFYLRRELGKTFPSPSTGAECFCCGPDNGYGSDDEGSPEHLAQRVELRGGRWVSRCAM